MLKEAHKMEEREILVKVESLSKKFCKDLKTSLKYGVQDLFSNLFRKREEHFLRDKEFWALQNINFELHRGQCLGLIGHNGAGKSTLLKILNGLIKPDTGTVTIKGKVGALIELGAGFNPILTGLENIYNNGAVLGFTKKEIDEKVEEIIDFAEIREFIDMPVQNYSSGMKVRLGFAVAAQMQPDVLIIDEVLAVGDLGFVLKCFKTIDTILPHTAIVFVSHNMPLVSRICNQVVLLEKGETVFQGDDVAKAIDLYYSRFATSDKNLVYTDGRFDLRKVEINNKSSRNKIPQISWNSDLTIEFEFLVNDTFEEIPLFHVIISDIEQRPVAIFEANEPSLMLFKKKGVFKFSVNSKNIQLSKGLYNINIVILNRKSKGPHYRMNNVLMFQLLHEEDVWQPFLLNASFNTLN